MMISVSKLTSLGLFALLLSGCSGLIPDKPQRQTGIEYNWQEQIPRLSDSEKKRILDLTDYDELDELVKDTLAANFDLRQTALRLKEQQLLAQNSHATRQPELCLQLDSQRIQEQTINTHPYNSHNLVLNLNWELDVWGRLADASLATDAETDALKADFTAAQNSLTARVIQSWIDLSLRQQIINSEQQRVKSLQNTEAVIKDRFRNGLGQLADLESARVATAQALASLASVRQSQQEAIRQLAQLRGINSNQIKLKLDAVPQIQTPPVALPATVLGQRPDLIAAYHRVLASDLQTSVSHKQLLPSFNLMANLSQNQPQFSDLLSGSSAWSLLGRMTAPLFNAGRLKRDAKIAELQAERSYLVYQQTLVNALNEVEITLSREHSLNQQQQLLTQAKNHAQVSLQYYQARYQDGLADILDLLNAQQTAFDSKIQLLQAQQARLTNRVTLALALGMGV